MRLLLTLGAGPACSSNQPTARSHYHIILSNLPVNLNPPPGRASHVPAAFTKEDNSFILSCQPVLPKGPMSLHHRTPVTGALLSVARSHQLTAFLFFPSLSSSSQCTALTSGHQVSLLLCHLISLSASFPQHAFFITSSSPLLP